MASRNFDRSPPPFFRQGPSAGVRLVFFGLLSVGLMLADARWQVVDPLRAALATGMQPLQRALAAPLVAWERGRDYLDGIQEARPREEAARATLARQSAQAAQADALARENARLRALLELRPALSVRSQAAEVLYEAADPYSRKVFLDRGQLQGVQPGSPVINEAGVLGQVTRVYPLMSEVTLLGDRRAAIPVLNERTQARSAAFGGAGSAGSGLELRFIATNADVREGDLLVTSGLDGVYPPGLHVARVAAVNRRAESAFADIALRPAAPTDGVRHVLVLEPLSAQLPAPPQAAPAPAPRAAAAAAARAASRPGVREPRGDGR